MPSHRPLRVAEAIREVVSTAILHQVADPRVKGITVLTAEVSPDLRQAVVYVSAMGTKVQQELAMRGLRHATGYLQARVAARLQTRHTPVLSFRQDDGVKKSIEIAQLIDQAMAEDRAGKPAPAAQAEGVEDLDDDDDDDETDEDDD